MNGKPDSTPFWNNNNKNYLVVDIIYKKKKKRTSVYRLDAES